MAAGVGGDGSRRCFQHREVLAAMRVEGVTTPAPYPGSGVGDDHRVVYCIDDGAGNLEHQFQEFSGRVQSVGFWGCSWEKIFCRG